MDEKTNEALFGIATQVTEWLKGAGDLVAQEAPVLAQEVVRYGVFDAAFGLVFGIAMLALCVFCVRHAAKGDFSDGDVAAAAFVSILSGLAAIVSIPMSVSLLGKIILAPRLYLLEQMAKLVN